MSLFEHSLAFSETETMVLNAVGFTTFPRSESRTALGTGATTAANSTTPAPKLVSRRELLTKLNTSPEVLIMTLISCCNSLTSSVLAVLGLQSKYRFVNTTIWAFFYMAAFVFSAWNMKVSGFTDDGFLRYPTVCIVGFIPHLMIGIGILVCMSIYFTAVFFSMFSPVPDLPPNASLKDRFLKAKENVHGSAQLTNVRFNMHEDFYSALLRVGFTALTAASEAVFLREGRNVEVRRWTWLEEETLNEIEDSRQQTMRETTHYRQVGSDGVALQGPSLLSSQGESGYTKERLPQKSKNATQKDLHAAPGGVGAYQRSSRHYMVFLFFKGILWLMVTWTLSIWDRMLNNIGITWRPRWLRSISHSKHGDSGPDHQEQQTLRFWMLSNEGALTLPENDDVDVAVEMKRRLLHEQADWDQDRQETLDTKLYEWWKAGGWWGTKDDSGDYTDSVEDFDDTTSVVSMSTNAPPASEDEWESEASAPSSRQTTPTPANPYSREPTPFNDTTLDPAYLSRLLHPRTEADRQEAYLLSQRLSSPHPVTRAQSRRLRESERARLFLPSSSSTDNNRLTEQEERDVLEQLIMSRRIRTSPTTASSADNWASGAEGMGASGPQCVVCHSSPRSIIMWPCRCLCVCEGCRVDLAMNNFGNCVCCRRGVEGFSRLFVP